MSNKPRGLGRGLGDLLADNAPEVRPSSVIRRDEDGEVSISPTPSAYGEAVKRGSTDTYQESEEARPLVFPAVTPIISGAQAQTDEARPPIDEAREILEADAAITGRSLDEADQKTDSAEAKESGEGKDTEPTAVYPRSLKAVFRNFK